MRALHCFAYGQQTVRKFQHRGGKKLRVADNEIIIVTFTGGFTWLALRPLDQAVLAIPRERKSGLRLGGEAAATPSSPNTPAELRMAAIQKRNMGVEFEPQFLRPLDDVLAVDTARKCLIFHLLTHTRDVHIEDRSGRFYQDTAVKKPASSSHAKRAFARCVFLATPEY